LVESSSVTIYLPINAQAFNLVYYIQSCNITHLDWCQNAVPMRNAQCCKIICNI